LQTMAPQDEIEYLRKNNEHMRSEKHRLEDRLRAVEQRKQQYKTYYEQYKNLYEQARKASANRDSGEQEISSLHEQLKAVGEIKDALFLQNTDLVQRLEASERKGEAAERGGGKETCVICMDNLANMVCLPCKHLALCTYCDQQQSVRDCPICRRPLEDKMQIYMP